MEIDDIFILLLLCAQAEAGSRAEVYEAQISKMQRALERADQETSRLEQALLAAQAAAAVSGSGAVPGQHVSPVITP